MTDYYVRKTGDDAAAGTSPATAWLTVDHGINTMAAGDTLYIGGGVYHEMVTVTAGGTSGNPKTIIGDFAGVEMGDCGPVVITAHPSPHYTSVYDYVIDLNEKEFLEFYDLILVGGAVATFGDEDATANWACEGVRLERCYLAADYDYAAWAVSINVNTGATPATSGLQVINCVLSDMFGMLFDRNGVAHTNLKWNIENCVFSGSNMSSSSHVRIYGSGSGSYSIGGITVEHCTFFAGERMVYSYYLFNTVNPVVFRDNICMGHYYLAYGNNAANTVELYNTKAWATQNAVLGTGVNEYGTERPVSFPLMGGIADIMWYNRYGWSPWRMFEPIAPNICMGGGLDASQLTSDLYDQPRPMGPVSEPLLFYFDASDSGPTDPDTVWTWEVYAFNGSLTNYAYCSTQGSKVSNYLIGGGTNAPDASGIVSQVRARVYGDVSAAGGEGRATIYTAGAVEELGTVEWNNTVLGYSSWFTLSEPAAGWGAMADNIPALEVRFWKADAGGAQVRPRRCEIEVN